MNEEALKALYDNYAKDQGFKDLNEFKGLMSDDNARKAFFDASNNELGFKDQDDFEGTLGIKKKVNTWDKSLKEQLLPGDQSTDSSLLPSVSSQGDAPAAEKTSTPVKSLVGKTPEETEALLRANAQEQYNKKNGISTERPVLKKFEEDFYKEVQQSADSLSSIYNKRFELIQKSFDKEVAEDRKRGVPEEEIQAKAEKLQSQFKARTDDEFNGKINAIHSEKLDKYRDLSEAELKEQQKLDLSAKAVINQIQKSDEIKKGSAMKSLDSRDPRSGVVSKVKSVAESGIKSITNIATYGYAQAFANAKSSYTEDFDTRLKKDGTNAFQEAKVNINSVDKNSYKRVLEELMSVDDPEVNLIDKDKITRDALIRTEEFVSGKDITDEQFKDIFKSKYNTVAGEYKADYVKKAARKGEASVELLTDMPKTFDEAVATGRMGEYISSGVGEVLGSSAISVGTLGAGGVLLNTGEVYDRLLTNYASDLKKKTGQDVSKEDIVALGQDKEVMRMTEYMAPIVSSLDLAGTVLGVGGIARNMLKNKAVDAGIRQFTKRGAAAITGRALLSGSKAIGVPAVAEVFTEGLQSFIPMLGSNIIANKIRSGSDVDQAIMSLTDEEWDELYEVAAKVGLSMGVLGAPGSVISGARSAVADMDENQKFDKANAEVITDQKGNQFVVSKDNARPRYRVVAKPDGTLVSVVSENTEEPAIQKVDKEVKSTSDQSDIISAAIEAGNAYELNPESAETYSKGKDKVLSKLGKVSTNLFKVIGKVKSVAPRVVLLTSNENAASMAKSLGFDVKSDDKINGWYNRDTNTMFVTPNTDTAIHEIMMHPVIDALKQTAPERYQEFIQQVAQLKTKDAAGNETTFLEKSKKNYEGQSEEIINEEAVVDYLTKIADKGFDGNFLQKIVELFEKYFGVKAGEFNINLDNPTDVQIFAKDLSKALRQARPITLTKDQTIPVSARVTIDKIKAGDPQGATFNPDFSEYTGDDDIVTLVSENIDPSELTAERVEEFKNKNKTILKEPNTKFGVFRMDNGKISLDVNVAVPFEKQSRTLGFAKKNNQESIYSKKGGGVVNTGGTGETTIKNEEDAIKAAREINDPSFSKEYVDNSGKTQEFFSDVVTGKSDKFKPVRPYQPIMKNTAKQERFNEQYSKFKGNFDEHIATSIPGFRDVQVKKGRAIIDALPNGGTMIDIAGSEGGLNKAITKISGGEIMTINLDVNKDMQAVHNAKPVAGAEFKLGAFFNDYEDDGFVAKRWIPEIKADVVHESMGFQFMSPQRDLHIKEVADNYLKPDGMIIVEEKVGNPQWEENEVKKDRDFKSRFYTAQQIEEKNKAVKVSDFDANEGMAGNMVTEEFLLRELSKNFSNVRQYWDAGNFKGYVASNDKAKVDKFMDSIGSTNTEFSNRNNSELVNISPGKNNTSFQAEKLVGTKIDTKKPLTSTAGVAKFLNTWAKKNNIFGRKNVDKMDEAKALEILVPQIRKELQAWDEYMSSGYRGFYDQDVAVDVDTRLKRFATEKYGRQLTDQEVALYHVLSSFASPSATPEFDSQKGLLLFDRYLRTGEVAPYDYSKDADVYAVDETGKRVPTGEKKKTETGETIYPQVSVAYASESLNKFNQIVEKVGGLDNAIDWISSQHSYSELSEMVGKPTKGPDALKAHEYLSKEEGGYGVFAMSGPKLGSYILNRLGNLQTVTKDMWYARSMARLFGEPLVDGKTAIKKPWEPTTKVGVKKRRLADKAFQVLADERGVTPAVIQQQLWDFEKKLWQQLGANDVSKPVTAYSGLEKGIEQVYQNRGLISKAERVVQDNLPVSVPADMVPFSKEKVTKTTERVVAPENSAFENLHNAFDAANPDPRFTGKSQETKKMLDKMATMTDQEIADEAEKMGSEKLLDFTKSFQGNQNFSLLFLIEQMKRAARSGDDTAVDNVWDTINQVGHTAGQLLAQMRALESATDNNQIIKKIISRLFTKAGVDLTNDQKAELSDLVEKFVITASEEKKQYERYDVSRTPVNHNRLVTSRKNFRKAANELQLFIDDNIPESLMDTLGTLLRGNLLSPISLGRNVFGNTVSMATSFTEAGIVYPLAAKLADPKNARMLPYWLPIIAGARGGWTTLKTLFPSISDAYFGTYFTDPDDSIVNKFEIRRQIRPLRSLKKLLITLPREVASGQKDIAQGLKEGLQNLLYATAGIPASIMFRALQATDVPFSEGFKAYHDYIEFYSQKANAGKPISELEGYQRNLSEGQKEARQKFARTGLFSDPDSFAAKVARKLITQTPLDIAEFIKSHAPGYVSGPSTAALMFMRDALAPYTTVPSNVVWTLFEYAVPVVPFAEAGIQFKKGNKVLASQLVGRGMNAVGMYIAGALIYEAGLMIDGDDDKKEKNDKQLKYAVGQPYGLNVDGLARMITGGDPTRRDTDRIVDARMLGISGLFMAFYSNYARKLKENGIESRPIDITMDQVDKLTTMASEGTRLALDMSFMMGVETALTSLFNVDQEAKGMGYGSSLAAQTIDTYSNAIWPNTLSQAIIGANNQGPLGVSRESFGRNVSERLAKKHFFFMKPDDLYPTLDVWGQRIENKEGIKNMANLWKSRTGKDPVAWEVMRLMDSTGEENPITIAQPTLEVVSPETGKSLNLTLNDSDRFILASLSGRFTKMLVSAVTNDPSYESMTDAERVEVIKDQNKEAKRIARDIFKGMFMQDMEDGKISIEDEKSGKYKRTEAVDKTKAEGSVDDVMEGAN